MAVSNPDWLARHGGEVQPYQGDVTMIFFDKQPQYYLAPIPVAGKFGYRITMTINGKSMAGTATYPTADAALQAGLEELRQTLGW